ncbi:hypothetical protein CONCODRAFT_5060 [Conidiobolus coronatus NRRL 28638]|uniref:Peptidase C14 caspase domain-containing protein n=1 Tax=Conidiobolus coronatus (strain ATCC 28846 / CBS 209.66 / NRRL 28638) TaxID=796925 RepID=A0A137PAU3_CONC2|nr:hypothetical protein CONCODRAFT_5060 [Conidiobolus coronatus NRRL 28638]|eukprot:KXN72137.1 hypothetical protein CONCODRAFT_5060 [Conidiobolus coronatus NRRL 28638]
MSYPGDQYRQGNNNNNNNFPPQGGYNQGGYNNGPPQQQQGNFNQFPSAQQFGGYDNNNNQQHNFDANQQNMPFTQNQPNMGGGGGNQGNFGGNPPNQGQPNQQEMQSLPRDQPLPEGFQQGQQIQVSNFSGKKRALLIGINYFKTKAELRGCINDVQNVKNFLMKHYGFRLDDMVILTDDQQDPKFIPTRQNMINAMHWLVGGAQPNDSFFFHYSGHGSQQEDKTGDEDDGFDETICPVDYERAGMIIDDEMNDIMVKPLPQGCRLTAIFDCCHSGTALDLPYVYNHEGKLKEYNPGKVALTSLVTVGKSYMTGDIMGAAMGLKSGLEKLVKVMFSGCKDTQTSADTQEQGVGATGAMSYALIKSLTTDPYGLTYLQLLNSVRQILRGKYQQLPQLSSGRPMNMESKFMIICLKFDK